MLPADLNLQKIYKFVTRSSEEQHKDTWMRKEVGKSHASTGQEYRKWSFSWQTVRKDSSTLADATAAQWKTVAHANQDFISLQNNYSVKDQSTLIDNEQLLTLRKSVSMNNHIWTAIYLSPVSRFTKQIPCLKSCYTEGNHRGLARRPALSRHEKLKDLPCYIQKDTKKLNNIKRQLHYIRMYLNISKQSW